MKLFVAAFLVGFASAGINPELSVSVSTKDASELSGRFDPAIKWSTERDIGECNVEGGVNMKVDSLAGEAPFNIWGKVKRSVAGWNVQAKLDTASNQFRRVDIDVEAEGGPTDCKLRAQGSVDTSAQSGEVREVGLTQSFEAPGGNMAVSPSYNLASRKGDVVVAYENIDTDTTVTIAADMDKQRLTVSQRIDEDNEISPSITSDGDIEVQYKRVMGDGLMTANYKPNDATSLKYEEGPWVASANFPMDGFYQVGRPGLAVKRSVKIDAF